MSRCAYPGESEGKAIVRQELYRRAITAWRRTGKPSNGYAIVLAGDDAMEVELLRDYLDWDPKKVVFADTNIVGLRTVKRLWPEAGIHHGLVREVIERVDRISFLHLDFMGHFNEEVERTLVAARGKLPPKSVVAYTFYRSREHPSHRSLERVRSAARQILSTSQCRDMNLVRWVGHAVALQDRLGLPNVSVLAAQPYSSSGSPMGVIALQNAYARPC